MLQEETSGIKLDLAWDDHLSKHDMSWVVRPLTWDSGAFIGNGLIGAMIYGEENSTKRNILRFVMGRTDVTASANGKAGFDPRVPIGEFHLELEGWIYQPTSIRLDLWNAEVTAHITTTKGEAKLRALVHSEKNVLVIELETSEGERNAGLKWYPYPEVDLVLLHTDGINLNRYLPEITVKKEQVDGIWLGTQQYGPQEGCITAWKEEHSSDDRKCWFIATANGHDEQARNLAVQEILAAESLSFNDFLESHRDWWHRYYKQSFVSIPNARLESFYWIQMYKLASATRADCPIVDNQGPWLTTTPWPGAWFNMNVQMSYSPVYTSNRLEIGKSLVNALHRNMDHLIDNVPEPCRSDSAGLGRNSSLDMRSNVSDETGNLTWVCHNIWRQYRYSMDRALLEDLLYPLLRRSVNYYLHILTEGDDGKLHLPPTVSPEYGSFIKLTVPDCHYDLALLRWGCETLLKLSDTLKTEDPLRAGWENVLERLTPYPVDQSGLQVGRDTPLAFGHRHFSHMLAVFPLHLIGIDSEEERKLVGRSLKHWLGKEGDLRGFSFTGAASISATLGWGSMALQCMQTLMHMITPNTMYKEAGPVIETPLAGAEAIHDMLLQSWGDMIRIFPAVPEEWHDAAFHQLRAEGAFLISAARKRGKTRFVSIKSLAGEACTIKTDWSGEKPIQIHVISTQSRGSTVSFDVKKNGIIELSLKAGDEVVLYEGEEMPELVIRAVENHQDVRNYFGGRKPWRLYNLS